MRISLKVSGNRRQGFTLIELLVVVAIIALLAAILFPVFARAREKARQSTCQSNLKQIGLGFAQYGQDYDGHGPYGLEGRVEATSSNWSSRTSDGGAPGIPPTGGFTSWNTEIFPYIRNSQVFTCPDACLHPYNEQDPVNFTFASVASSTVTGISYDMNIYLSALAGNADVWSTTGAGILDASIAQPANCIEVTEGTTMGWQASNGDGYLATGPLDYWFGRAPLTFDPNQGGFTIADFQRAYSLLGSLGGWNTDTGWIYGSGEAGAGYNSAHGNVRNVLFCDGHVKALQIASPGVSWVHRSYIGGTTYSGSVPSGCEPFSGSSMCAQSGQASTAWNLEGLRYWIPNFAN